MNRSICISNVTYQKLSDEQNLVTSLNSRELREHEKTEREGLSIDRDLRRMIRL